ncbi:MAG TPA: bifunctional phosphopantothenoylcysteine decarboxylase/phosphopantothenate--cysteine ligase CoaBC [Solirubrobacteraceae bacterium]|nr:bifunctional phosphopantothenoylcysteine decarboxylase/phosphopantothenate--cysteine ligase CoaBC [Solirubrobacteraceae bacterium]
MARLLIGVSGGIAAYKALETARLAIKAGHSVRVVQTEASTRFVGPASFSAITGAPVLCDAFDDDPLRGAYPGEPARDWAPITHLALVQRADLFLIAPASANTLAKLAHGLADNLLTTAALAATCPVVVAPAMNHHMWRHPATRANLELLRARGVIIVEPGEGDLASRGEHGAGRLAEPAELIAACAPLLAGAGESAPVTATSPGPWLGRRVLVTAGGTREPIDSVRFIGNRSSGRMGYALAAEARRRGAEVTIVSANVSLPAPPGTRVLPVGTAAELQAACEAEFDRTDLLLMAAAVADFRPTAVAATKLKKDHGPPQLALEATTDVLATLAARRHPGQRLVGFAAEHGDGAVAYGREKLSRKGLDAIVINDIAAPGIGFDTPDNAVTILTAAGGEHRVARAAKAQVAAAVLDALAPLWDPSDKERDDRTLRAGPARTAGV